VAQCVQFAAPMPIPGQEVDDGVNAMFLDKQIVKLWVRQGKVHSFRLKAHAVAEPCGIANPKVDG